MKILRIKSVIDMTGIPRSSLYRFVKSGHFPAPIKLGPRAAGWLETDIQAWIAGRQSAARLSLSPLNK